MVKNIRICNQTNEMIRFDCNAHYAQVPAGAEESMDWAYAVTPWGTPDVTVTWKGNSVLIVEGRRLVVRSDGSHIIDWLICCMNKNSGHSVYSFIISRLIFFLQSLLYSMILLIFSFKAVRIAAAKDQLICSFKICHNNKLCNGKSWAHIHSD